MAPVALPNLRDSLTGAPQLKPADAGRAPDAPSRFFSLFGQCLTGDLTSDPGLALPGNDLDPSAADRHSGHHAHHSRAHAAPVAASPGPDPAGLTSPSILNSIAASGPASAPGILGGSSTGSAVSSIPATPGAPVSTQLLVPGAPISTLPAAPAQIAGKPAGLPVQPGPTAADANAASLAAPGGSEPTQEPIQAGVDPDQTPSVASSISRFSASAEAQSALPPVPSMDFSIAAPAPALPQESSPSSSETGATVVTSAASSGPPPGARSLASLITPSVTTAVISGPAAAAPTPAVSTRPTDVHPAAPAGTPGQSGTVAASSSAGVPASPSPAVTPAPAPVAASVSASASAANSWSGIGHTASAPSGQAAAPAVPGANGLPAVSDGNRSPVLPPSSQAASVSSGHHVVPLVTVQPAQNAGFALSANAAPASDPGVASAASPAVAGAAGSRSGGTGADSFSGSPQQDLGGSKNASSPLPDPKAALVSTPVPANLAAPDGVVAPSDTSSLHRGLNAWDAVQNDESPRSVSLATPNELHLSMHTDELGRIDLHATLHGDAVGATISVQKSDAGAAIAAALPHLEHVLHEQQIPVSHLSLAQGGAGMSHSNSQSHGQAGQQARRTPWTGLADKTPDRPVEMIGTAPAAAERSIAGRLSIRA